MCSRTVSDTANRLLKRTNNEGSPSVVEEKSSAVPLFRSDRRSPIFAVLIGKGEFHKRVETAGVYPLVRPRGVSATPRRGTRHTPAAAAAHSSLNLSEKLSALIE